MTEALKPCPFCGHPTVMQEHDNPPILSWFGYFPEHYYSVNCSECGISMSGFWTKDKAIQQWNRRAPYAGT